MFKDNVATRLTLGRKIHPRDAAHLIVPDVPIEDIEYDFENVYEWAYVNLPEFPFSLNISRDHGRSVLSDEYLADLSEKDIENLKAAGETHIIGVDRRNDTNSEPIPFEVVQDIAFRTSSVVFTVYDSSGENEARNCVFLPVREEYRRKSIEQLEDDFWPERSEYESGLVASCYRLRKKPLGDFTPNDLRMMFGQNIGTEYLLPLALDIVEHDPFVDATFYKGDLLNVVLLAERECFSPSDLGRIQRIAKNIFPKIREMPTDDPVRPGLIRAISHVLPLPLRCPCCFCLTLESRADFDICPVCFWEDDGQDEQDAGLVLGGPNGDLSLTQARKNYQRFGACDEGSVDFVRGPHPSEKPVLFC